MTLLPLFDLPITGETLVALVVGDNQRTQPVALSRLISVINSATQKAGTVTYDAGAFSVVFSTQIGSPSFQTALTNLPNDVTPTITAQDENGFSGTYIGAGSGTGGFISAIDNN